MDVPRSSVGFHPDLIGNLEQGQVAVYRAHLCCSSSGKEVLSVAGREKVSFFAEV